jgi:hypothetical protein
MPTRRKPDQSGRKLTSPTGVGESSAPMEVRTHRAWDRSELVVAPAVTPSA